MASNLCGPVPFLAPKAPALPYLCRAAGSSSAERLSLCRSAQPRDPGMERPLPEGPVPLCRGRGRLKDRQTGCRVQAVSGAVGTLWVQVLPCPGLSRPHLRLQVRSHPAVSVLVRGAFAGDAPGRTFPACSFVCSESRVLYCSFCALDSEFGGSRVQGDCGLCHNLKGGKVLEHLLQNCLGR